MSENTARTTITIPKDLLRLTKVACAGLDISMSQLIQEALEEKVKGVKTYSGKMPKLGKYCLKSKGLRRKAIYAVHLRRKISF